MALRRCVVDQVAIVLLRRGAQGTGVLTQNENVVLETRTACFHYNCEVLAKHEQTAPGGSSSTLHAQRDCCDCPGCMRVTTCPESEGSLSPG